MAPIPFLSIILTGGRGSRLGEVRKDQIRIDGKTLAQNASDSTSDAHARVMVGPPPPEITIPSNHSPCEHVWEEPHYGGPAAAIATGWNNLKQQISGRDIPQRAPVLILAVDLPHLKDLVSGLLVSWRTAPPGTELVLPKDVQQKDQNAAIAISQKALDEFLRSNTTAGDTTSLVNAPLKKVFAHIPQEARYQPVFGPAILQDIDTPDDLEAFGAELPPR